MRVLVRKCPWLVAKHHYLTMAYCVDGCGMWVSMQPSGSGSLRLFGSGSGCRFGSGLWYVMMIGFGQCAADESLMTVMCTDLRRIAAGNASL